MPFGVPDFHALHIEQGMHAYFHNDFHTALVEFDQALDIKESVMARWDRAHALLSMGRYEEGWNDFAVRYQFKGPLSFTEAGLAVTRRLEHWDGDLNQRVVLLHEAGFGDTIMFLRYAKFIPHLTLEMPAPLHALVEQCGELGSDGDAWCSTFDLPRIFCPHIPAAEWLKPDPIRVRHWENKIRNGHARRIGIVWSSNTSHFGEHENQTRSLPLSEFLRLLPLSGALFSLQHHEREEADRLGVHTPDIQDFADTAALASLMDVIVSIDSGPLHVAGSIGHPNVFAILSWAPTWRWCAGNRWYPQIKLCHSQSIGDWSSAFAQLER